ncbi:malonyl CoA-acyl carrier protein transacylase [Leifsonia sp. LS1]|uniref:ACP S-malonyltransferase n=1 Tax=Leifsonia sp. LS1 TaxID=2828483 RepID=UPI001CFC9D79|nr:ACP S-malonyltransferase [Leifsonia sp. LS1]GIT78806.1 malonyl CoA-acyl carrier protein transacylase [Leifsonia sp. LS1]
MEFFAFPGQGSHAPGMGRRLASRFPAADDLLCSVEMETGVAVRELMWESPVDVLTRTENAQPAIVALSLAALEAWRTVATRTCPDWVSGHSVGSLAAAVASGSLTPAEGVRLARRRGEIMATAPGDGRMLAVAVASDEASRSLTELAEHFELDLACFNGPRQIVLAGASKDIAAARRQLGARSAELKVSHAFHSRLMDPVVPSWKDALAAVRFQDPQTPYLSSRTGQLVVSGDRIRSDLARGIREPVRWDLVSHKAALCQRGTILGSGASLLRMWRGSPIASTTTVVDDNFTVVAHA